MREIKALTSLRGIAALFVVFNHYAQAVPEQVRQTFGHASLLALNTWATPWPWLRFTPLRLLVNAEGAVDLFFVLSGFVLAMSLTQDRQPEVWRFIVKRICRIYLPFATIILIIAGAYAIIPTAPSAFASHWLNDLLPIDNGPLSGHLLMTGQQNEMKLDPVMWTLVHEFRISFILPVVFLAIRKIGAAETVAVCLLISVAASFGITDATSGSWLATLHFLWMFAVGSALCFHRGGIAELIRSQGRWLTAGVWLLAIVLLELRVDRVWSDFAIGAGAATVIALCLSRSRVTDLLVTRVPLWLGRVSYSLYLIHLPILVIAITGGLYSGPAVTIFLATFVLAELAYRAIEAPAHRLGVVLAQIKLHHQPRLPARAQG